MLRIEGKDVYLFKLGKTSSIYLNILLTTPLNLDISKYY